MVVAYSQAAEVSGGCEMGKPGYSWRWGRVAGGAPSHVSREHQCTPLSRCSIIICCIDNGIKCRRKQHNKRPIHQHVNLGVPSSLPPQTSRSLLPLFSPLLQEPEFLPLTCIPASSWVPWLPDLGFSRPLCTPPKHIYLSTNQPVKCGILDWILKQKKDISRKIAEIQIESEV